MTKIDIMDIVMRGITGIAGGAASIFVWIFMNHTEKEEEKQVKLMPRRLAALYFLMAIIGALFIAPAIVLHFDIVHVDAITFIGFITATFTGIVLAFVGKIVFSFLGKSDYISKVILNKILGNNENDKSD